MVDETLKIARQFALECLILCDTSHRFEREGAQTLVFSKGGGQRGLCPGEPAAPRRRGRDPGLRLGRHVPGPERTGAEPGRHGVHGGQHRRPPAGAHTAKKIRNAGGRLKGPAKRTASQDRAFSEALMEVSTKTAKPGVTKLGVPA